MTDVTVPSAVREAGNRADELIRQIAEQRQEPTGQEQQEQAPAEQPTEAVAPAAPAPEEVKAELRELQHDESKTWEQKYKSLQGMILSQMRPLQIQVQQLTAQKTELEQALEQARQAPAAPLITEQDKSTYGEDMLDTIARQAREALQPELDKMSQLLQQTQSRNQQLEAVLAGMTEAASVNVANTFYDRLDQLCPDWEKVNTHPQFLGWLNEYDPVAGGPRITALQRAFQNKNANDVVFFFNAWKNQSGFGAKRQDDLQTLVSPSKGAASPAPAAKKQGRQWSRQDVSNFYRDKAKMPPAEAAALEQDLFHAQAEGRIS